MSKVNKLFAEFKKNDLLEDRREYDEQDLQKTYNLKKKDAKLLSLKLKKWSLSKKSDKTNKNIKMKPTNSLKIVRAK